MTTKPLVALIATALVVCGCSNSSFTALTATAPTSSAPALITCSDITTELETVVADLKAEAASLQEAWVSGGHQSDLQAMINDVQSVSSPNANNDGSALETDASQFYVDASQYLIDNSPYLAPGWQAQYDKITSDINSLATDCGLPTAPVSN